jgi:hypothetical protein
MKEVLRPAALQVHTGAFAHRYAPMRFILRLVL